MEQYKYEKKLFIPTKVWERATNKNKYYLVADDQYDCMKSCYKSFPGMRIAVVNK